VSGADLTLGIAQFLEDEGIGGLYDDPVPANRTIFIDEQPGTPAHEEPEFSDLVVVVRGDGGAPARLTIENTQTISILSRHKSSETAKSTAWNIHNLLQMNGGQSNGANAKAKSNFNGVLVTLITSDFPPTSLGRDSGERDGLFRLSESFTVKAKF